MYLLSERILININKLNSKCFITYFFLQAKKAPGPPLFFRMPVTQDASLDKALGPAGKPEWQRWKSVQGWWIILVGGLFNREEERSFDVLGVWKTLKVRGLEQNVFRKCCFVY